MPELIDRGALRAKAEPVTYLGEREYVIRLCDLDAAPTVTCGECEHEGYCQRAIIHCGEHRIDDLLNLDFCSNFERREGGG